jgi:two-component system, NarL family, sensor kinase
MLRVWQRFRCWLESSIGAPLLSAFALTVLLALLVALISLSAHRDATSRLENLQDTQRRVLTAVNSLELATELQSEAVQAFLLSGDQRYLQDQARGQARFDEAFDLLDFATSVDEGMDRLDDILRARERFQSSATSQLTLYQQGWSRSATYLWRTEGQDSKQELERQISAYRSWNELASLQDVEAARERGRIALTVSVLLIVMSACLGLIVGVRLTRSITNRLGTLAAEALAIAHDDFSARAAVSGRDEVAALGAAMNQMAEHLEHSQQALELSRQKLRDSLEQYRLLSENALDIVYALDREGRYTYINAGIEQLAGYKPEELIGRSFTEVLPSELRDQRLDSFERRMRGEDVGTMAEIEYLAKDGRRIPLELRLSTIFRDGEIVGMQGIARDVTRRRAMEAQIRHLAEQEHRRAEQLQEVARVSRKIGRLSSLDALLPNVASLVHEVFGYERVSIYLSDQESRRVSLRAWAGNYREPVPQIFSLAQEQGLVGWVAAHGEPVRVDDVRDEPRYVEIEAAVGTCSELVVPIRAAGEVLGALNVESTKSGAFDMNDEATLMILADEVGTAVQNARLFEQQHSLAVAEERNRLAREIHDTLAQGLTGIALQLEVADALLDIGPEQARPKILKALELTRGNLEEARRSVMDLRAAPLQEKTLPAALEELVSGFGQERGIQAEFGCHGLGGRLPAALEAGLYRIAQEALTNVAKHAEATALRMTLERVDDTLVLSILDDGTGFDPNAAPTDRRRGGFGLIGMHERARLLGGQLEVTSAPDEGTRIDVRVPAPQRAELPEPAFRGSADGQTRELAERDAADGMSPAGSTGVRPGRSVSR